MKHGKLLGGALIAAAWVGYGVMAHWVLAQESKTWLRLASTAVPLAVLGLILYKVLARHSRVLAVVVSLTAAALLIWRLRDGALPHTLLAWNLFLNTTLLWSFGHTLLPGRQPLIAQIAERVRGHLPEELQAYARRVTIAWTLLFAAMIVISLLLFNFASMTLWSLFVNVLYLPLVAAMFFGEYLYRTRRYSQYDHSSLASVVRAYTEMKSSRAPQGY